MICLRAGNVDFRAFGSAGWIAGSVGIMTLGLAGAFGAAFGFASVFAAVLVVARLDMPKR